jgi:hypothetical protein
MQTWLENYKWQRSGFEKKNSKIVKQTQPTVGPSKSTDMKANILDSAGKTNKKEGDQNCDAVTPTDAKYSKREN